MLVTLHVVVDHVTPFPEHSGRFFIIFNTVSRTTEMDSKNIFSKSKQKFLPRWSSKQKSYQCGSPGLYSQQNTRTIYNKRDFFIIFTV